MVKLLPFILVPILILGGLWYFRFAVTKQSPVSPQATESPAPVEVPKTLPGATLEDRVKNLEDTITKLASQISTSKSPTSSGTSNTLDSRLANVESAVTDLKTRVSALEKVSPAPTTSNKYPLYIPLGSGGGPWGDQDWNTLGEYQASINADDYPGYSSMQLEANFRLVESAGTGSVRLYNVTDGSSLSSQLDTTGTSFATQTSGTFKLPSGKKTYTIQVKSSQGKSLFVQSARVRVNF